MSNKRDLIARLFPQGIPLAETIGNNARFVAMRRDRFLAAPQFAERIDLYRHLAALSDGPITYLEFGVWKGDSIRAWRELNSHAASRFVGFDTFQGLPEDWGRDHPAGTFSTNGDIPQIDDDRVSFQKGLFQETLRPFLKSIELSQRLVVNVDCDIYSATLFVLGSMDRHFNPGTIVIFDDFYSMNDEFKAFYDYDRSFGRRWKALGHLPHCIKAAIQIEA